MIKKIGSILIKKRTTITMIVVLILLTEDIWEKQQMNHLFDSSHPWGLIGLALVVLGVFLRSWSAGIINKSQQLSTIGPYALVRHPLYLGSFLITFGFAIISADVENIIAMLLIVLLIYGPKIVYEEKKLLRIFGEKWDEYKTAVPCIVPTKLPVSSRIRGHFSWHQWKINKEYNAVITSIAALGTLHLMHIYLGM